MISQRSVPAAIVVIFALQGCDAVVELPQDPVYTIALTPIAATLANAGEALRFSAIARDIDFEVVRGVTITWTSQDTSVATVDSRGLATARGAGTTAITASVDTVSASAVLTVAP
jgi:uncharacterized protein YjdB